MTTKPVRLRIPEETRAQIDAIARRAKLSFSSVVNEMLAEDLKMRRVRGIYFANEFQRREAKVGGTGLGVWEVITGYKQVEGAWEDFKATYDGLDEFQLHMALEYYAAYPEEIDAAIAENESFSIEEFWTKHPETKPPWVTEGEPSSKAAKA